MLIGWNGLEGKKCAVFVVGNNQEHFRISVIFFCDQAQKTNLSFLLFSI